MIKQSLTILEHEFTIHRFNPTDTIPKNIFKSKYYWIGRTDEGLSIICDSNILINSSKSESSWSILKIIGEIDFSAIGIFSGMPLQEIVSSIELKQ